VLKKMSVPYLRRGMLKEKYLFEDKVLDIAQPDEPGAIRWQDLDNTLFNRATRIVLTTILSACLIVAGAFLIAAAQGKSSNWAAITIILLNTITPMVVRFLTSMEYHRSETSRTASQYLKVTAFRWLNSVIILFILNAFADTLKPDGIINNINSLFFAEIIQRPAFQLLDMGGFVNRHVFGPRAVDQRRMNLCFQGSGYDIGERYTEITKILFLTFSFAMLYPLGFFYASAIFSIYYWVDKYCILRLWAQRPRIGIGIFNFSAFFFQICILAYVIMAAYFYAQFPFDNACNSGENFSSSYIGAHFVKLRSGTRDWINITSVGDAYSFCHQEQLGTENFPPFPSSSDKWMNGSQRDFTKAYAWTALIVLIIVLGNFAYLMLKAYVLPLFFKPSMPISKASKVKFSEVMEIYGYIPQVIIPGCSFPFLLCEKDWGAELLSWNDESDESFKKHNLIYDVEESKRDGLFSIVKSWM